jgi:hypothetical protein
MEAADAVVLGSVSRCVPGRACGGRYSTRAAGPGSRGCLADSRDRGTRCTVDKILQQGTIRSLGPTAPCCLSTAHMVLLLPAWRLATDDLHRMLDSRALASLRLGRQ